MIDVVEGTFEFMRDAGQLDEVGFPPQLSDDVRQ